MLVAVLELPEENILHRQRNSSNSLTFSWDTFTGRWLGTPCSVLVPNQECGKVYELIFYFQVLYACVLLYSVHVEQVLQPKEQLFSFKIPFLSCILLCSCITIFTHTNLFLNWTIQWKLQSHNRYVYACFFNRFALINSSVDFNFNCVYSWLLISCTLLVSQQNQ